VVNQCYDSPTLNNIFCSQFQRNLTNTKGPSGEDPGRILNNTLINAPVNFAKRTRRGVDVNFAYRHSFGDVGFDTSLIYTHNLENSNFQDPTNPTFETRVLQQLGDPKDEFRWDMDLGLGAVTLGYRMHYIGPQYRNTYGTLFSINGQDPTDLDAFPTTRYPAVIYHDIRVDFDLAKDAAGHAYKFYMGADNVLNRGVPAGATTATGAGSAIYSFRGRTFYAGFRARF
jgi:outer membrane receptor for ferrienterochelin and colicin